MTNRVGLRMMLNFRSLPRFYWRSKGLGAYKIVGDCLRPYLLPDDLVMVDSTLDEMVGELVLVDMQFKRFDNMIGGSPRLRSEPAVKQLVEIDGERWLTCATGAVPARHHALIAPVVGTMRRGFARAAMCEMDFRQVAVREASRRRATVHRFNVA
jgi:hypothetical protein